MKKWFDIAVLVTLVSLVACSKVDRADSPVKISYAVASYVHTTKAGELNLKDDEGVTSFRSKAWLHAAGAGSEEEFLDETISWDGTAWSPSRDIYWPKHPQSYLNFVSWYDAAGIEPTTVDEDLISWGVRTIGATDHLLVARAAWFQTNNTLTYGYNGITGGVPTLFRNMLASICINMRANPLTDPEFATDIYEVSIQSAYIEGVYQRGSLDLVTSAPTETGTTEWTNGRLPYLWNKAGNTSNIEGFTIGALTDSYVAKLPMRSILPQQITDDVVLHIVYRVITKSNGVTTADEMDIPASIQMNTIKNSSDIEITDWVPNTRYTYNITINPVSREILLNPSVEEDWSFATNLDVTVE